MKTKFQKTAFLAAICLLFSVSGFAQQKGEMAVGLNLNYGTNSTLSNFGLGTKFQWNIINNLRLEPSFNYYFGKDLIVARYNMWDANVNVHYLFPLGKEKRFMLYPLAGIGLLGTSVKYKNEYADFVGDQNISASDFAFNIGGGAEYLLSEKFSVGAEIKYQIVSGWNRPVFTLGAAYRF